ncbi:MAG: response regulator [Candidatus Portnoybacteria bacterium]|nr:response regulator [Candidatus Portnoybacteria bacterium]
MDSPKKKILLIEDDSFISQMYSLKFKQTPYDFLVARDGKEGLQMVKEQKPDLILLDIILPEIDGFTLLAEIKKDPELASIPLLLLTNLGQQENIQKGMALGANDYIIKAHYTPQEVVEKVEAFLK